MRVKSLMVSGVRELSKKSLMGLPTGLESAVVWTQVVDSKPYALRINRTNDWMRKRMGITTILVARSGDVVYIREIRLSNFATS